MKDNLEDLLKQLYAQKEEPSQEFCQSVVQKMKGGNQKGFFLTGEKVYYKGILTAAICAGIIILAGIGIQVYRQGDLQNRKASLKQEIAQRENQLSDVTEGPFDEENGTETESLTDGEEQSETKNGSDEKKQVETAKSSDGTNKVETSSTPDKVQKRTADSAGESDAGQTGSDSDTGSESRNSQIMKTMEPTETSKPTGISKPVRTSKPMETPKPMLPSETGQPQETPDPEENYIAVCSIESYTFSSTPLSPTSTEPPTESPTHFPTGEEVSVPDSVFGGGSWLILSYEQLQTLIGELEEQLLQNPNHGIQNSLLQLEKYAPSYFVSNALCVNLSLMDAGFDIDLQAVWMRDGGQGDYYLEIYLDKTCDEIEQTVGMKYYASFVSVPQEIAGQCNMVLFQFYE